MAAIFADLMTTNSWLHGQSGDWTIGSDWSSGAAPSSSDTVTIAAAGAYTVTLYTPGVAAALTLNDPGLLFYLAGTLAVAGTTSLAAGTLDLAYGTLQGGVLALGGGTLEAQGGTLSGVAVQGALNLSAADSSLFVTNGITLRQTGSATGSVALTGAGATLGFIGSQTVNAATIAIGSANAGAPATLSVGHAVGASSGATLTLGGTAWLREVAGAGVVSVGGVQVGAPVADALVNDGTITASGGTLTLSGPGTFTNAGTIGVSGGAVLDIATAGIANSGTIVVAGGTLDLGGSFAASLLGNLGSVSLTNGVLEIGGTAENAGGTLTLAASGGVGPVVLAGTIAGGTLVDAGGLGLGPGSGVLDGVAYQGTLSLAQAGSGVTLADGTTLANGSGGAGTATVTGAGAELLLQGTTTLDAATITLGSASGTASLGTVDPLLAASATTATLGPGLVIQAAAGNAAIDANAQTPIPNVGLSDTIVSNASITESVAGGTLTVGGYGTFLNDGSIAVSGGGTMLVSAAQFTNAGTITVGAGSTAELGAPGDPYQAPAWSNDGVIGVNGGTLALAGTLATAQLGSISVSGGTIALTGTLENAGTTLSIGGTGTLPSLCLSGTIAGGTIADRGLLSVGAGGSALLDGVSYNGTLAVGGASQYLRIRDGFALSGVLSITGAGAAVAFQGSETLARGIVRIGSAAGTATLDVLHDYGHAGGSTLSLGTGVTVTQTGACAAIGSGADLAGDAIVSAGTINAGVAGGTLTLAGAAFTNSGTIAVSNGDTLGIASSAFRNNATLSITNASLAIEGAVTLGALGNLALSNAAISVSGTLNAAGGTLTLGSGSNWGRLGLTGTIVGGTLVNEGGGLLAGGSATLSGVTFEGALDLTRPFQKLAIANGITVTDLTGTMPGNILVTGPLSRLMASTSETFGNCTIYLGDGSLSYAGMSVAPPALDASAGTTLTLAASATLRTAGPFGTLGDAAFGQWTDTIVNDGLIIAASAGGTLTIGSSQFINQGALLIGGNDNVLVSSVDVSNQGSIAVTLGSDLLLSLWNYYASPDAGQAQFSNSGTIRMLGGVFAELTGNGLFPAVPVVNQSGGLIMGLGTILAPITNNGTIESTYGPNLLLTQPVSGTGTLLVDPNCTIEFAAPVSSGQTLDFTGGGETLKLDLGGTFAAAVANFGPGDTLDLANTPLLALAISSGTLVATGTNGSNFVLDSTSLLGGELSARGDGQGGSDITYTPQAFGGAPAAIPVSQPAMLFWASPVGDVFTGTSANLNGARIGNWGVTDSLDLTDMAPGAAQLSFSQQAGQAMVSITDGTHSASITLFGTWNESYFHLGSDGGGGTLVTYHP